MVKHFKASSWSIALIFLIVTLVSSNLNWGKDSWQKIIAADGKGYYAYLPATFIYKDLNFTFFDSIEKQKYYNPNSYYDYRSNSNGIIINKYYCGTAITEAPFFFMAHFITKLSNGDADGFSKWYSIFVNVAALFYLLIGLVYLRKSLYFFNKNEWQVSLILFAAVFGTNLFYYSVVEPSMSHVYSFAFISMFLFYAFQLFRSFQKKYLLILGLLLGIIFLIRPVNLIVIFALPFVAGSLPELKKGLASLWKEKVYSFFVILIFFAIISIQFIIYKISTGSFLVYAYGGEGFKFLSPHFIDILFSYKKGLFLYTPLYLFSFLGLYFLYKKSSFSAWTWLAFFIIITYVFSSWWMWFYGGSFSGRIYVEFIPMFMFLLAIFLNGLKNKAWKIFAFSTVILLVIVCQIQTYQYRYYDIHWSDMTKEKYWDVFLRIDKLIK